MGLTLLTCTGETVDYHHNNTDWGVMIMKGYVTATGYMGYVNGRYVLFADESDYRDYILEHGKAA